MSMGLYGLEKPEGKGRLLPCTFSFLLSLLLSSMLPFFSFVSLFLPLSFVPVIAVRSTTHQTTNLTFALPHRTTGPCTSSDRYRTV